MRRAGAGARRHPSCPYADGIGHRALLSSPFSVLHCAVPRLSPSLFRLFRGCSWFRWFSAHCLVPVLYAYSLQPAAMEGWLHKKSTIRKWDPRYFVLKGGLFMYKKGREEVEPRAVERVGSLKVKIKDGARFTIVTQQGVKCVPRCPPLYCVGRGFRVQICVRG